MQGKFYYDDTLEKTAAGAGLLNMIGRVKPNAKNLVNSVKQELDFIAKAPKPQNYNFKPGVNRIRYHYNKTKDSFKGHTGYMGDIKKVKKNGKIDPTKVDTSKFKSQGDLDMEAFSNKFTSKGMEDAIRSSFAGKIPGVAPIATSMMQGARNQIKKQVENIGAEGVERLEDIARNGWANRGMMGVNQVAKNNPKSEGLGRVGELLSGSRGRAISRDFGKTKTTGANAQAAANQLIDEEKAKVTASRLGLAGTAGLGLYGFSN